MRKASEALLSPDAPATRPNVAGAAATARYLSHEPKLAMRCGRSTLSRLPVNTPLQGELRSLEMGSIPEIVCPTEPFSAPWLERESRCEPRRTDTCMHARRAELASPRPGGSSGRQAIVASRGGPTRAGRWAGVAGSNGGP